MLILVFIVFCFFFSGRRRHTRCALVTGVQTCALPIWAAGAGNGRRAPRPFQALDVAFDEGARLDRQAVVDDVADDPRGLRHHHRLRLDCTVDCAADANALAANVTLDMGPFADGEGGAVDVAFDVAVDLDVTVALQVAGDAQIGADDRGNASLSSAALWLRRSRSMRLRGARAVFSL